MGAASGEAKINVSEFSVYSSILTVTHAATQFDKRAAVERFETIRLRTLDECAAGMTEKILLKIDTQGYEKHVIDGGRKLLSQLEGIRMELPITHFCHGTWKFHKAVRCMEEAGFVPTQLHPVNYDSHDAMTLTEVDCLFRRVN